MTGELEPRHLRALITVADQGTFTDAAITLGVSQSAVSRTLLQFEQIVGTPLMRRTTRAVSLTAAGQACYPAAVAALRALDAVTDAATGRIRPLRIGYSWAAFGRHTSVILRTWRGQHPEQPVEVHRIDERTAGLRNGAVDLAVIRGAVAGSALPGSALPGSALPGEGLREEELFVEGRLAALPTGHRLAAGPSVSLTELAEETLVWTPMIGTTTLDLWEPGARPARTVEVDNIDEWLTVIASGEAVGLTPESTSFTHPHSGVTFVPVRDAPLVSVRLAWPLVSPHPAVAIFADLARMVVDDSGSAE